MALHDEEADVEGLRDVECVSEAVVVVVVSGVARAGTEGVTEGVALPDDETTCSVKLLGQGGARVSPTR